MRIGVFSDVHGHLDELARTLTLLEDLAVDQLVCLGDLVDKGTQSDAVVELMRTRAISCVQGNHDAKAAFMWLTPHQTLHDRSIDYLSRLPPELRFTWAGVTVYACHANPWHDPSVYVYPTRPQALFKLVADAVPETMILMGHTHHPMRVEIDGRLLLNPGSIYGNRDRPERTCALLSLPDGAFTLYDIDSGRTIGL